MGELSWWLSPHPDWEPSEDWPQEVPVVRYENEDEVALIDPFLPPDGDFDPRGKPVKVLFTQGRITAALPTSSSATAPWCGCRRAPSGAGWRIPRK